MALGKATLDNKTEVREKTEAIMEKVESSVNSDKDKMKLFTFKMNPEDRETLRHHFMRKKGKNWSQGIRDILYAYMDAEGLL